MKRINLLSEETSNKIAAGEVVERPYSVVKELLENSIDANSKVITVEIEEGGQKSIVVTDDGEGINPEDVEKAFLPHATSKINSIEDIYAISTLGFRGEALPSIAAISNTTLRSRVQGFNNGMEISISGGVKNYIKEVGTSLGTTIEVRNIFYNVPARQKFLKASQREAALISDIVNRLALANPSISFKLISNGKKVINTFSSENIADTIRTIYGKKITDNIIKFEKHTDIASVYGYVGNAEIVRGSRNNQSIFLNKRYIKNKLIATAVESAVKSFLMINKYPFFVLFLEMFPEFVDVNVHPTKSEVKFQNDREIFKLVFDAVHEALANSLKGTFEMEVENSLEQLDDNNGEVKQTVQLPMDLKYEDKKVSYEEFAAKEALFNNSLQNNTEQSYVNIPLKNEKNDYENSSVAEENSSTAKNEASETAKFPALKVIGQYHNSYIIAESAEDFYLIDQHAAHEKILFEMYTKRIKSGNVAAQILLTPEVMELSAEDFVYYIENKEIFANAGFNIEEFGDNTISLREVPNFLGKPELRKLFMEILDNLKKLGSGETYEVKYHKIATISCKAAVKAKSELSMAEMITLVNTLRFIDEPFNCPHGRPTIIRRTLYDIEKIFKRIQ